MFLQVLFVAKIGDWLELYILSGFYEKKSTFVVFDIIWLITSLVLSLAKGTNAFPINLEGLFFIELEINIVLQINIFFKYLFF